MRGKWRLLSDGPASAAWNMAVDEAIMTMVGRKESPPTLRIYGWDPPALSLGYFQRAAEVDLTACRSRGVDVVRRPTGGRAILHDQEVTYSLSLPEDLPWLPRGVTEAYRLIAGGLVRGLKILGVPVEMAPAGRRGAGKTAACFDAPCSYEIVARGRKLVGSAQTRRRRAVLQHGSIPLKLQTEELFALLHFADPGERSRGERLFAAKAISLDELMDSPGFDDVWPAIVQGLGEELGVAFEQGFLTPAEEELAGELVRGKYANDKWNLEGPRRRKKE